MLLITWPTGTDDDALCASEPIPSLKNCARAELATGRRQNLRQRPDGSAWDDDATRRAKTGRHRRFTARFRFACGPYPPQHHRPAPSRRTPRPVKGMSLAPAVCLTGTPAEPSCLIMAGRRTSRALVIFTMGRAITDDRRTIAAGPGGPPQWPRQSLRSRRRSCKYY